MNKSKKYYFTFGPTEKYPYQDGWVTVIAVSMGQAVDFFKARFGEAAMTPDGYIACSTIFPQEEFRNTSMYTEGNYGVYCHEVFGLIKG